VQELRPSAQRSELAFRALRVSDSSPLADSGSLSKNFFSWQRGRAATWEQRTFEVVTKLSPSPEREFERPQASTRVSPSQFLTFVDLGIRNRSARYTRIIEPPRSGK
jgi:hypothetical protein